MKKYLMLVICALMLFVVTGCGKEKVVCKGTFEEDGMKADAEMSAELDGENISNINVTYILEDEKTAKTWCALFQLFQDEEKGVSVKCSGKKITIKGMEKMDSDEEEEGTQIKTKEEFIKYAEEQNMTCK